ncbi:hypothetical protein Mpe_A1851 [Methylibium petroleiphilum PM1]|uniref:Uncharacterized protein n=1 Tax=Methylibium petroleiphilum (strain ATCC BAA-1232 / LMG 22953 / PM1) TaxID=420662 RepID=A2SGX0_METPP|nr:hypothetical protein Mpe_A1851 [Methylibium petroleiphilum PM1]
MAVAVDVLPRAQLGRLRLALETPQDKRRNDRDRDADRDRLRGAAHFLRRRNWPFFLRGGSRFAMVVFLTWCAAGRGREPAPAGLDAARLGA